MDCKHCFHWDKASETFNTEIESCCDCGYVKFPRLNNAEEAIKRVSELADYYDGKEIQQNPMGYGQLKNESNSVSHRVAAYNIRKALSGENFNEIKPKPEKDND